MRKFQIVLAAALIAALSLPVFGQEAGSGAASEPPAGEAAQAAAEFTCPMHPEVRQPGAGQCPQCNMDLVPAGSAASTGSTTATTGATAP